MRNSALFVLGILSPFLIGAKIVNVFYSSRQIQLLTENYDIYTEIALNNSDEFFHMVTAFFVKKIRWYQKKHYFCIRKLEKVYQIYTKPNFVM